MLARDAFYGSYYSTVADFRAYFVEQKTLFVLKFAFSKEVCAPSAHRFTIA